MYNNNIMLLITRKLTDNNESFDNLHIILLIHVYALSKICQVNRKDRLKNMPSTTLEVIMLADVSRAYSVISNVYQCVTGPL